MSCFCGHVEDEHDGRCYVALCPCLSFDTVKPMTCEICDDQTAVMWVVGPFELLVSCSDCGPQLGYKILAPLESVSTPR